MVSWLESWKLKGEIKGAVYLDQSRQRSRQSRTTNLTVKIQVFVFSLTRLVACQSLLCLVFPIGFKAVAATWIIQLWMSSPPCPGGREKNSAEVKSTCAHTPQPRPLKKKNLTEMKASSASAWIFRHPLRHSNLTDSSGPSLVLIVQPFISSASGNLITFFFFFVWWKHRIVKWNRWKDDPERRQNWLNPSWHFFFFLFYLFILSYSKENNWIKIICYFEKNSSCLKVSRATG